jgi:hypothetical protein
MNAEQYRALVTRLEAIQNEAVADGQNPNIDDATRQQAMASVASDTPAVQAGQAAQAAGGIVTIDAPNFKQAYAQAVKQGLKQFKWCGTYAVKSAPTPQAGKAATKVDFTNQASPLGGDEKNPMSFAPNSNFGA